MSLKFKTNPGLVSLCQDLRKKSWEHEAPIWRDIADELARPTKARRQVNVSRVDRHVGQGEIALVPGKLLAAGELTKPLTVVAYQFSQTARAKVLKAGGKCLSIPELVAQNPKGDKVRIIG